MREIISIPTAAEGVFLERPNRFLGIVGVPGEGGAVPVHVHDPGRLGEILYPGNKVLLRRAGSPNRKTAWDLIAGECEGQWVLVHSGLHRSMAERILEDPEISPLGRVSSFQAEVRYDDSRLDFLVQLNRERVWVETKGCTLCREGVALFPDAPTGRGRRHLEHLTEIRRKGERTAVAVLVFRPDATCFAPNGETDPRFAEMFWSAVDVGVEVYPLLMEFCPPVLFYKGLIPLKETG